MGVSENCHCFVASLFAMTRLSPTHARREIEKLLNAAINKCVRLAPRTDFSDLKLLEKMCISFSNRLSGSRRGFPVIHRNARAGACERLVRFAGR